MARVKALLLAAALFWPGPASADPIDRWTHHISEASVRFAIPEAWIRRVMRAESGGHTRLNGRPTLSRAGAMGLMQLMPGTWRDMRARLGLGRDPHEPRDNILAGTAYLRAMYDQFGYPGLFAAYNAGPARYAQHLASGRRLPAETVAYVASVAGSEAPSVPAEARDPPAVFAVLRPAAGGSAATPSPPAGGSADALFVRVDGRSRR
jgi:soluble lytic murein transglycosylase-like protein